MSQVAQRYAVALFELTEAKKVTSEVLETLRALRDGYRSNPELVGTMKSPLLSSSDKVGILKTALGEKLSPEMDGFLKLLSKNDRLAELAAIAQAYEERVAAAQGVLHGVVRSATTLSQDEQTRIQKMIETKLKTSVHLTYQVQADMIGGIEAQVGSYIFEDNVKSHMSKLNDFITRRVQ